MNSNEGVRPWKASDAELTGSGSALHAPAVRYRADEYAVRMGMSVAEGAALSEILPRVPGEVAERVMDQLWLRSVLVEQRRRTGVAERATFDARADRILELLDPQEVETVADRPLVGPGSGPSTGHRPEPARSREVPDGQ